MIGWFQIEDIVDLLTLAEEVSKIYLYYFLVLSGWISCFLFLFFYPSIFGFNFLDLSLTHVFVHI